MSFLAKPPFPRIQRDHPLARGLVGAWLMTETSGLIAHDVSGNGNDGVNNSTAVTWSPGAAGSTLNMNGNLTVDNRCTLPALGVGITAALPRTWATRVYPTNLTSGDQLCPWTQGDALTTAKNLTLYIDQGGVGDVSIGCSGLARTTATGVVTVKTWADIVVTYPGGSTSNLIVYVNGVPKATSITGGADTTLNTTDSLNALGWDPNETSPSHSFVGLIDNVMAWNRVLSPAEVLSLYADPYAMFRRKRLLYKLAASFSLSAAAGAFAETGEAVVLNRALTSAFGAFTETGEAALLSQGQPMPAAFGSFSETGEAATFAQTLAAAFGNFVLTDEPVTLIWGGTGLTLTAASGSFGLTGEAAAFKTALAAAAGAIAETGEAVLFGYGIAPNTGVYTLTPQVATFKTTINVSTGNFSETGEPATLAIVRFAEKTYAFIII